MRVLGVTFQGNPQALGATWEKVAPSASLQHRLQVCTLGGPSVVHLRTSASDYANVSASAGARRVQKARASHTALALTLALARTRSDASFKQN